jgi:hypothetical protein
MSEGIWMEPGAVITFRLDIESDMLTKPFIMKDGKPMYLETESLNIKSAFMK